VLLLDYLTDNKSRIFENPYGLPSSIRQIPHGSRRILSSKSFVWRAGGRGPGAFHSLRGWFLTTDHQPLVVVPMGGSRGFSEISLKSPGDFPGIPWGFRSLTD
jgi:hypothetical protein